MGIYFTAIDIYSRGTFTNNNTQYTRILTYRKGGEAVTLWPLGYKFGATDCNL